MRLITWLLGALAVAGATLLALPATPAAASGHSVTISNYTFGPSSMTIAVGDTVTWTNTDQASHDVTTISGPVAIHGSTMAKGQSWSYTFTTPGTYTYICSIHPDMKATLWVTPAVAPRTSSVPARTVTRAAAPRLAARRVTTTARLAPHATTPMTATTSTAPVSASPVAAQPAATATGPQRTLKPLLLLAGLIAAVTTLCLLILATRPEHPERR